MAQSDKIQSCPICEDNSGLNYRMLDGWAFQFECPRCGKYKIDHVLVSVKNPPWGEVWHLVSAWIRRQNKAGLIPTIPEGVDINVMYSPGWAEQFRHMGFPESTDEKLDILLLAYADIIKSDYKKQISYGLPHLIAEVAAKNVDELNGLTDFLKECGYVDERPRITAKGWRHVDELRKAKIASNSAFIAMWFDDSTKKYRDAAITSIEYCGYKAVVVDQQEYNDFIMNQVISLIRQSRFLVADFTARPEIENDGTVKNGVRGGVYWEAGMAYGLGRPVMHTCEDSRESRSRIHFDVNQYNTIFWKEDELNTEIRTLDQPRTNPNFAEKLAARILATVGKGNYNSSK
jgi:nucleoside 2-deoxyribosyltransferase